MILVVVNAPSPPYHLDIIYHSILLTDDRMKVFIDSENFFLKLLDFGESVGKHLSQSMGFIFQYTREHPQPNRSRFTLLMTSGTEKLAEDPVRLQAAQGPTYNKSLLGLASLSQSLAQNQEPEKLATDG